jgi:hypothetical protein
MLKYGLTILTMMAERKKNKEWECRTDDFDYWTNRGLEDIITDYVRDKIAGTPYNSRNYVGDLMEIEMFCVLGIRCPADVQRLQFLIKKYPDEYVGIRSELDPEWPNRQTKRCTGEYSSSDEYEWLKLGGRKQEHFMEHYGRPSRGYREVE